MPTKQTKRGERETSAKSIRRTIAVRGLESQLERGTKPFSSKMLKGMSEEEFNDINIEKPVPLIEGDKKRIKKEIAALRERI